MYLLALLVATTANATDPFPCEKALVQPYFLTAKRATVRSIDWHDTYTAEVKVARLSFQVVDAMNKSSPARLDRFLKTLTEGGYFIGISELDAESWIPEQATAYRQLVGDLLHRTSLAGAEQFEIHFVDFDPSGSQLVKFIRLNKTLHEHVSPKIAVALGQDGGSIVLTARSSDEDVLASRDLYGVTRSLESTNGDAGALATHVEGDLLPYFDRIRAERIALENDGRLAKQYDGTMESFAQKSKNSPSALGLPNRCDWPTPKKFGNPGRVAETISADDLWAKIEASWKKHPDYSPDYSEGKPIPFDRLTATIKHDLSKVQFDTENMSDSDSFGYSSGILGLHTLDNGLTFLGVNAGEDGHLPLFFAIYWDGKALRAYIPEHGNLWNTDTKSAYGHGEIESDLANLKKRIPSLFAKEKGIDDPTDRLIKPDSELIKKDLVSRISVKAK